MLYYVLFLLGLETYAPPAIRCPWCLCINHSMLAIFVTVGNLGLFIIYLKGIKIMEKSFVKVAIVESALIKPIIAGRVLLIFPSNQTNW